MLFSSSFYTTVGSDGLHEPYLLLTNSPLILILSDSHIMWDVQFGSNLSKFGSKNLKDSLMSLTLSPFSNKVRCFNQSEHALYRNFIIIKEKSKEDIYYFSTVCVFF